MKKISIIILTLVFVPQMLFSQIKKIDKINKAKIHKKIKEYNSGDVNTKAMNPYPDYNITNKCYYNATPQGFSIEIKNLKHTISGAESHIIIVNRITPEVYSHKKNGVNIFPPDEQEVYLGNQTTNHGVLNNGNGWARDESGQILYGDIYKYRGAKFGLGNVYTGSRQEKTRLGFYSGDCSQSSLNYTIQHHTTGVPSIEGSSTAFNNHSEPQTSSGNGTQTDWAGQLYEDYYAANGQPGWNYTMVEYEDELNDNFIKKITYAYLIAKGVITRRVIPEEFLKRYAQLRLIQKQEYIIATSYNKPITAANQMEYAIVALATEYDIDYQYNQNYFYLPIGFGTSYYPSPKAFGSSNNTKKLYPSYLFDEPKSQNWYAGNSLANQNIGFAEKFNHEPLPTYCNPNNDDYIPAAFLNPLVLEELRQDWSFLTYKNIEELKQKGYYFYDDFYTKFYNECQNQTDCDNQLITENPNLQRRTYLDPNGTMPVINNATNTQNSSEKSKTDDEVSILPKPKMLVKTEDYYSDLINNKLITMNPEWLVIKNQKKCMPKYKAINNSINTGKKFKASKLKQKIKKIN